MPIKACDLSGQSSGDEWWILMRDDIGEHEFKILRGGCELTDLIKCGGGDCRCCCVYNNQENGLYHAEMEMIIPKSIVVKMGVEYVVSSTNTVAKFISVDDVIKVFSDCIFNIIRYSPTEMYKMYPTFFKVKAYLSLGVPQTLLGNGIYSPLISVFGDGSVYVFAPVIERCFIPTIIG